MLQTYQIRLRKVPVSAQGLKYFHAIEAGAATLVTRNYDEDNITKVNSAESQNPYFL